MARVMAIWFLSSAPIQRPQEHVPAFQSMSEGARGLANACECGHGEQHVLGTDLSSPSGGWGELLLKRFLQGL